MAGRYTPIRDYAAIGDGRTAALVALDGSVDWLCLPNFDSPSVFAGLLDANRGGCAELRPDVPFEAHRRYLPDTNVLETTFVTERGAVRVTDAMTLPGGRLTPFRELARRVEGLGGRVPMRWRVTPRFGYGLSDTRFVPREACVVASCGGQALGILAWEAGPVTCESGAVAGRFDVAKGQRAMLALTAAHGEPLVFPARDDVEGRLDATAAFWRQWAGRLQHDSPWREAVVRSALVLKLLVFAPSGAIAAAATTSLPERLGGERNWDYRFCWVRDSSFSLEALLQLGCRDEARSFFWWFMHTTKLTLPRLQVFYRLDGGAYAPERTLALEGYEGSWPVRIGNGAADQLQLDTYGELFDMAFNYARRGGPLGDDIGRDLARAADFVCEHWREPDAGIWEIRAAPRHHTQSKAMCWVALDRAIRLAEAGALPAGRAARWRAEAAAIRRFVDERCWSARKSSYVGYAGGEDLDASLLLLAIMRYDEPGSPRLAGTVEAVRRELARGPLLYRYTGDDGLSGGEGAFLCCSFWLVEALAIAGRRDEAARLLDELVAMANDLGLYAEELEPSTRAFLGNFPQALVHLALISAAVALAPAAAA
ncbi:MAG TPA: glycoside hydrolase family 15 protein [Methylomirabilota bacterium]|nr:glycoside hydrolase family 15 protein [Methylomirabilota bacterium]